MVKVLQKTSETPLGSWMIAEVLQIWSESSPALISSLSRRSAYRAR